MRRDPVTILLLSCALWMFACEGDKKAEEKKPAEPSSKEAEGKKAEEKEPAEKMPEDDKKAAEPNTVRILTASADGNYFKAATQLQGTLKDFGYKLDVRTSPGSFHNVDQLGLGKTDLAIAQFDTIMVYVGLGEEGKKKADNAQALAPLGEEFIHVIVNKKAGIKTLADLKGKRISVGPEHSGSWISAWNVMFHLNGVNIEEDDKIVKATYQASIDDLVEGELDAAFITTAQGMPLLKSVPDDKAGALALLSLGEGFKLDDKLAAVYQVRDIPAGTYPFQDKDARTLATSSYLLASKEYASGDVQQIAAALFSNAEGLKAQDPIWSLVSLEHVKGELDRVPYHKGVLDHLGLKRP